MQAEAEVQGNSAVRGRYGGCDSRGGKVDLKKQSILSVNAWLIIIGNRTIYTQRFQENRGQKSLAKRPGKLNGT